MDDIVKDPDQLSNYFISVTVKACFYFVAVVLFQLHKPSKNSYLHDPEI